MNLKEAGIIDIRAFLPARSSTERSKVYAGNPSELATITVFPTPNQTEVPEESRFRVARRLNDGEDSKAVIERLGFKVLGKAALVYDVALPPGFTKENSGSWTSIFDPMGNEVLSQFNEGVPFAHYSKKQLFSVG